MKKVGVVGFGFVDFESVLLFLWRMLQSRKMKMRLKVRESC